MTLGNILSQMGLGKHVSERLSHTDYAGHDPHMIYAYEPAPAHEGHHIAASKHHHGGGGHKSNAAMSALTLLAFLFFLNILQQCLREHMTAMSTPQVVVMTAGREGEEAISKTGQNKLDKTGINTGPKPETRAREETKENLHLSNDDDNSREFLMKIETEEYTPKIDPKKYKQYFIKTHDTGNESSGYHGFVSAMTEK